MYPDEKIGAISPSTLGGTIDSIERVITEIESALFDSPPQGIRGATRDQVPESVNRIIEQRKRLDLCLERLATINQAVHVL